MRGPDTKEQAEKLFGIKLVPKVAKAVPLTPALKKELEKFGLLKEEKDGGSPKAG